MAPPLLASMAANRHRYIALAATAFGSLLLLWSALTYGGMISDLFLPTPTMVARALVDLFVGRHFLTDVAISTLRILGGFSIAAALGIPAGLLIGISKSAEAFFEPLFDFIRYTPIPAFIPLFILWLGIGETEKVTVIASSVFFQIVLLVANSVSATPTPILESARTLGAARWDMVTKVVFRYAQPRILDDLRVSMGWAWAVLTIAEIVGASSGIGFVIVQSQRLLQTANVIAAIVVVGFLACSAMVFSSGYVESVFPGRAEQATMLVLESVTKTYDGRNGSSAPVEAIGGISLTIGEGQFWAFVGPSGAGKTTLLRLIAGLDRPSGGRVVFNGQEILTTSWERGMVFQDFALFPWLTVSDNIAFGLRIRREREAKLRSAVSHYLQVTGLDPFKDAYPLTLSGGMQQRVAIARTLANAPKILLLDEPFGALDVQTRGQMQELLAELWEQERITVVLVTHDLEEALFLADRVCVLSARPAVVRQDIVVPFGRPRNRMLKLSDDFFRMKRDLARLFFGA